MHIDGSIWRYTGTPCSGNNCPGWQLLDNNWALNDGANYLHAVNIADGTERQPPVAITATDAHGVRFDSRCQRQRPGLLLLHGVVYLGFGTFSCDGGAPDGQPYRGWILGYRASDLAPAGVYCASPDGGGCGVWQSGGGLVGGPDGAIYFETGNDDVNHHAALGDSFLRLPVIGGGSVRRPTSRRPTPARCATAARLARRGSVVRRAHRPRRHRPRIGRSHAAPRRPTNRRRQARPLLRTRHRHHDPVAEHHARRRRLPRLPGLPQHLPPDLHGAATTRWERHSVPTSTRGRSTSPGTATSTRCRRRTSRRSTTTPATASDRDHASGAGRRLLGAPTRRHPEQISSLSTNGASDGVVWTCLPRPMAGGARCPAHWWRSTRPPCTRSGQTTLR